MSLFLELVFLLLKAVYVLAITDADGGLITIALRDTLHEELLDGYALITLDVRCDVGVAEAA